MKKYAIYCTTDKKFEHVISNSIPTECPTDAGHTIDSNRIIIVDDNVQVLDGTPIHSSVSLADYKALKNNTIDYKTGMLIAPGFVYDSKTFSTSVMAQQNWSEIHSNVAEFSDPILVSTKDSDEYSLTHANVHAFWLTGVGFVQGHLDSGRILKKAVFDAVDVAAVDAVVDNR